MAHRPGQKESEESARRVLAMEHERKAIELRKAGASYGAIGQQLKHEDGTTFSVEGARQCVKRAMGRLIEDTKEDAEELRTMEEQRLDSMLLSIWDEARHGNVKKIETVLKIMQERAKLRGLYAPVKTEMEGGLTLTDERALNDEISALIDELRQLGGGDCPTI